MQQPRRTPTGLVDGILSGDTIVIRSLKPPFPRIVASLKSVIAPRFGSPDGRVRDEPHGWESWNFLREQSIGRRVFVPESVFDPPPPPKTRKHPAFGVLPVVSCQVQAQQKSDLVDLGLLLIEAGWVRLRPSRDPTKTFEYYDQLAAAEAAARAESRGVWQDGGLVRPLPVLYHNEDVLNIHESYAVVDHAISPSTWVLFLIPTHIQIDLRLAGVNFRGRESDPLWNAAREWIARNMIHRRVVVRLSSVDKTDCSFTGTLLGEACDGAVRAMVREGLLCFYEPTADLAPSADLYVAAQAAAIAARAGFWARGAPEGSAQRDAEGVCFLKPPGALSVITGDGATSIYHLACVQIPYYLNSADCEPWGFEAREFIRRNFVGRVVKVVSTGSVDAGGRSAREYAVVSAGEECINVRLLELGLAKFAEPFVADSPANREEFETAQRSAQVKKLGVWSDEPPPVRKVIELVASPPDVAAQEFQGLRGRRWDGVIEAALGGARYHVLLPEAGFHIKAGINGLRPLNSSDPAFADERAHGQRHHLQTSAIVTPVRCENGRFICDIQVTMHVTGQRVDIAEDLVRNGFAYVSEKATRLSLARLAKDAKRARLGVWQALPPKFRQFSGGPEAVQVTLIWDTVTFTIQFHDRIDAINAALLASDEKLTGLPSIKQRVAVRAADRGFRGRIKEVRTDVGRATVHLLDFGDDVDVELGAIRALPAELEKIEPQARIVQLGCVKVGKAPRAVVDEVWEMVRGKCLWVHLMYFDQGDLPAVLLTDADRIRTGSVNLELVKREIAEFEPHQVPPIFDPVVADLNSARPLN